MTWRPYSGGEALYKGETIVAIVYLRAGKYRLSVLFPNQKMGCIGTFHRLDHAKTCVKTIC